MKKLKSLLKLIPVLMLLGLFTACADNTEVEPTDVDTTAITPAPLPMDTMMMDTTMTDSLMMDTTGTGL